MLYKYIRNCDELMYSSVWRFVSTLKKVLIWFECGRDGGRNADFFIFIKILLIIKIAIKNYIKINHLD